MRFFRILKQRLLSEIRIVVDAPEYKFEITVGKFVEDSLGATRRPFILRIDGKNMVRHLFFVPVAYLETNIDRWQPAPENASCLFIPEYGRLVYIQTETLEKVSLPDQAMVGEFLGNYFFEDFLIVIYEKSVMITHIQSSVSACYKFDFQISDARMLDVRYLLLTKTDGSTLKFDRTKQMFV